MAKHKRDIMAEQEERLRLLNRINEIEDNICKKCPINNNRYCLDECEVGKEISSLGDKILGITKQRSKEIINRSLKRNKTPSLRDIFYLNTRGYSIYNLADYFGWDKSQVRVVQRELREYRSEKGYPPLK